MPFSDALVYMSRKVQLKADRSLGSDEMSNFRKLQEREISRKGIDAMTSAGLIPNGSLRGTMSNAEKARELGAKNPRLFVRVSEHVYSDQERQLIAAEIDALAAQSIRGPVPLRHSFNIPFVDKRKRSSVTAQVTSDRKTRYKPGGWAYTGQRPNRKKVMDDDKIYRKRLHNEAREEYLRSVDIPTVMKDAEDRRKDQRKRWLNILKMTTTGRAPDPEIGPNPPALWTTDDYINTYRQNITDAYHIVQMSSTDQTIGLGNSANRPPTFHDYERDDEFDSYNMVVYQDLKRKTVWLGSSGNRILDAMQDIYKTGRNSVGQPLKEIATEALAVLGVQSSNAIIHQPRYHQMVHAVKYLVEKYKNYDHIKLTGHSTGSTIIFQLLMRNPELSKRVTWASLFNMPYVNSRDQQKQFSKFLRKNPQIALMGTEFDLLDPYHRLYTDQRAHVLGAESNPSLQLTKERYQKMAASKWWNWEAEMGHTLNSWDWMDDKFIKPENMLRDQVTISMSIHSRNFDPMLQDQMNRTRRPS